VDSGPALFSILRQGPYLIASIHTALDDSQLVKFQQELTHRIGQDRSRGVIIDVAALDVLDSFATHTLRNIAEMARLRGAVTTIAGIQPDVAFAMVELGLDTGPVHTALDLEGALEYLSELNEVARSGHRRSVQSTTSR
jgi:rsbT antagonist protein RsbS